MNYPSFFLLFMVLSLSASEPVQYTGDYGNILLEVILDRSKEKYAIAKLLYGINTNIALRTTQILSEHKKNLQRTFSDWVAKGKLPTDHQFIYDKHGLSMAYTGCSIGSGISFCYAYVTLTGEIKILKYDASVSSNCSYPFTPQYLNHTFCWGYQDRSVKLQTYCIDARIHKQCEHPFHTITPLNSTELFALHTYFLRDTRLRIVFYANTIQDLSLERQCKLGYLFAHYASTEQFSNYLDYCCNWSNTALQDNMQFCGSIINDDFKLYTGSNTKSFYGEREDESSIFRQATHSYIDALKKNKSFDVPQKNSYTFGDVWQQVKKLQFLGNMKSSTYVPTEA